MGGENEMEIERPKAGLIVSLAAGLLAIFAGLTSRLVPTEFLYVNVLFGVLMISGGLLGYLGRLKLGGLLVLASPFLLWMLQLYCFPMVPIFNLIFGRHSLNLAIFVLGIVGGLLIIFDGRLGRLRKAETSLAAAIIFGLLSIVVMTWIFGITVWSEAPLIISTFVYASLSIAFFVSLAIGVKTKTDWWMPSSFILSGVIGLILNSVGAYLYTLWHPISYSGDWDSGFAGIAITFFVLLFAFTASLLGLTGGAIGVVIGKTVSSNRWVELKKKIKVPLLYTSAFAIITLIPTMIVLMGAQNPIAILLASLGLLAVLFYLAVVIEKLKSASEAD